jgi:hypothetical protein
MTPEPTHQDSEQLLETAATSRPGADELQKRCELLGVTWHNNPASAESAAVELIEPDVAVRLRVVPLRLDGARVVLAMIDPLDTDAADEIATLTGRPVTREGMEKKYFSELMREHYGTTASKMADAMMMSMTTSSTISKPSRRMISTGWPRNQHSSIW